MESISQVSNDAKSHKTENHNIKRQQIFFLSADSEPTDGDSLSEWH